MPLKIFNRLCRNLCWKKTVIFICTSLTLFLLSQYTKDKDNIWQFHRPEAIYLDVDTRKDSWTSNNNVHNSTVFHGRVLDWQEITEMGGSDDVLRKIKFFVYSAYMDFRDNENILRVLAVTPSHSQQQLFCHIFDKRMLLLGVVPGIVETTRCPQNSLMYSAAYIICELDLETWFNATETESTGFFQNMKFVSVSPFSTRPKELLQDTSLLSNILSINVPTPNDDVIEPPHKFGLCVQPTFNYDEVFEFVQWLEFHKMMGVSHFTFYNMSIGPSVSCVMKSKAVNEETPVNVLKWSVPILNGSLLHVNAQISQINDCAFRYRGVSKYLVSVDLDEAIIPNYVVAQNYDELIKFIDSGWKASSNGSGPVVAQYQFRGGFFGSDFGTFPPPGVRRKGKVKPGRNQVELEDLAIYKYVVRQKKLLPYKKRSKLITIPRLVIEPGVHELDEAVGDGIELMIPYEAGFLHHYRYFGCGNNCSAIPQVNDFTGHFFALDLLGKVRRMTEKLGEECDLRYFIRAI